MRGERWDKRRKNKDAGKRRTEGNDGRVEVKVTEKQEEGKKDDTSDGKNKGRGNKDALPLPFFPKPSDGQSIKTSNSRKSHHVALFFPFISLSTSFCWVEEEVEEEWSAEDRRDVKSGGKEGGKGRRQLR